MIVNSSVPTISADSDNHQLPDLNSEYTNLHCQYLDNDLNELRKKIEIAELKKTIGRIGRCNWSSGIYKLLPWSTKPFL